MLTDKDHKPIEYSFVSWIKIMPWKCIKEQKIYNNDNLSLYIAYITDARHQFDTQQWLSLEKDLGQGEEGEGVCSCTKREENWNSEVSNLLPL